VLVTVPAKELIAGAFPELRAPVPCMAIRECSLRLLGSIPPWWGGRLSGIAVRAISQLWNCDIFCQRKAGYLKLLPWDQDARVR